MKNILTHFVYMRRSMDDESRQVLSLPAQATSLSKVAKDNKLHLFEMIEESKSAKKPGRPEFNRMLDRIEAGGYVERDAELFDVLAVEQAVTAFS